MVSPNCIVSSSTRLVIKGEPIVWGFAVGRVFYYQDVLTREFEIKELNEGQVEGELQRLLKAIDQVHADLAGLKTKVTYQIDAKHAEIFSAHQLILKDIELFKDIETGLKHQLLSAEQIVQDVFQRWEKKIRGTDSHAIKESANDVADVGRRLLGALIGDVNKNSTLDLAVDSVIFAQRLLPSDTASLNIKNVKAIVTVEGTQNSHSAILARALDIPFVSKIDVPIASLPHGTQVIVDGERGIIIINPDAKELESYPRLIQKRLNNRLKVVERIRSIPLQDHGKLIKVNANVSSLNDIKMAVECGANGIGLYRTEPLYMDSPNFPTEEHLYTQLVKALSHARNQEINIRLLDIGGDKTLPFLDIVEIKDPALGLNGIRLLLKYPHLLEMQLRVFLRLSTKFNVKVLVPMVSLARDMMEVQRYFSQEKEKLRREGIPFNEDLLLGAMIETPAALMLIDELLDCSDFLSIGTNDLVQYVMAAGREKVEVSEYYEAGNHLILNSLKDVIRKTEARGKECSICGELAGNLKFTKLLLGIGLKNFSVQPALIPYIKIKILRFLKNEIKRPASRVPGPGEELAQDMARADDDGFALPRGETSQIPDKFLTIKKM
ncbi:MAG: phosphoenolpyruvate--protein phosphotransferase [Candidatus Omnitrophica bacterium]|nr:phosphoenolpyruvate--protein phosphotransferase [Candidatus Omnitrophota bacterium]